MLRVAALIPSPLVLVPELCGGAPVGDPGHPAAQVPALRAAVLEAGRVLGREARRWTIVGAGAGVAVGGRAAAARGSGVAGAAMPSGVGTFRGFGADVRVALSTAELAGGADSADPQWPCALLIGAWLRGRIAADVAAAAAGPSVAEAAAGHHASDPDVERVVSDSGHDVDTPHDSVAVASDRDIVAAAGAVDPESSAQECLDFGAALRARLDADPEPQGVLVVADGAATLSRTSPGYLDARAEPEQRRIDDALDAGDRVAIGELDPVLCGQLEVAGRPGYQVLAGLFGADDDDPKVETLYRAAPFGVGYHVSLWYPAGGR